MKHIKMVALSCVLLASCFSLVNAKSAVVGSTDISSGRVVGSTDISSGRIVGSTDISSGRTSGR